MAMNMGKKKINTAGVTFEGRQGKLTGIAKAVANNEKTVTLLKREPDNPYDANAIAVLVKTDNFTAKIGYMPKNTAFWLAPKMDAGYVVRAYKGHIVGGYASAPTLGWEFEVCWQLDAPVNTASVPAVAINTVS